MSQSEPSGVDPNLRPWASPPPGRLVGRGHPAGDFLEAWAWDVLDEAPGFIRVEAALPEQVKNPRGQLFGGFTPTYVDPPSLFTVHAGECRTVCPATHLLSTNLFVAALTGLWGVATPLFANADEPAHVVRAASVARGELVGKTPRSKLLMGYTFVKLPAIYDAAGDHLNCFARKPNRDASCHSFTGSESKTKEVITEAGRHPPAYYAMVGGISRLWPNAPGAVYLMRFATVLITALFVAFAVGALSRMASPRVALVGLAVALTPMVLSFGAAVNPTAPETAAAIATWACGLVVVSQLRERKEPDRGLVVQLGIAASALVLARQISMFWLAFIA